MKKWKKISALLLTLCMALCLFAACDSSADADSAVSSTPVSDAPDAGDIDADGGESGGDASSSFGGLPAGTYTYVSAAPEAEAGSGEGQVQFDYFSDTLTWSLDTDSGTETGSAALTGDALRFFQGLYLSDRPVTDWFGSAEKETEGYAGDVAGNVAITFTEEEKIAAIRVISATTRVQAILSQDITDAALTISGTTRGQPNLMQSCITLIGSVNALYLTAQGDVILDNLSVGNNGEGAGLNADKIGGDTFVIGTVSVDGTVEWYNKMGVITALADQPGVLVTNGQDITMCGGSNIGRVGRDLTISTGEDLGGNITIGATVTTDSTRGGLLPNADTSADGVTISTSGSIIAGLGDVTIGTNTEKSVKIDVIGNIQGENVTIQPVDYGAAADVNGSIGTVTATGSIEITVGAVLGASTATSVVSSSEGTLTTQVESGNAGNEDGVVIGDLTALNGDITLITGAVNGSVGTISAPNGTVTTQIESGG